MPIFEHSCQKHGRFESILPQFVESRPCPLCGQPAEWEWSLSVAKPDPYWSGHVDSDYGYVTSRSELRALERAAGHVTVGDRTDHEGLAKVAADARKAKEERSRQRMRRWTEKAFGPSGLGLGGEDGRRLIEQERKEVAGGTAPEATSVPETRRVPIRPT